MPRPSPAQARPSADGPTLAGLAATCLAIVCERKLFVGLLNFSTEYRPTALFSSMHTGGAALDAYFALTLPFICFPLMCKAPWQVRWLGALAPAMLIACFVRHLGRVRSLGAQSTWPAWSDCSRSDCSAVCSTRPG